MRSNSKFIGVRGSPSGASAGGMRDFKVIRGAKKNESEEKHLHGNGFLHAMGQFRNS